MRNRKERSRKDLAVMVAIGIFLGVLDLLFGEMVQQLIRVAG